MAINNRRYRLFLLLSIAGLSLIAACKKDKEVYDPGYSYYPLTVGAYKIYQAQLITYNPAITIENFEIKEVVSEYFTVGGEHRYRLERFKRANNTLPWPSTPDSVWSVAFFQNRIVKIENNTRLIKIVFPIENGKSWNANAENNYGNDDYELKNTGQPFTVLSQTFPTTATVLQNPNDSTGVDKDYRKEVFAKDIGMIFKVHEQYEYLQDTLNCGKGFIDVGIKYYERLTSYGQQ